jgi:hypothetical protein
MSDNAPERTDRIESGDVLRRLVESRITVLEAEYQSFSEEAQATVTREKTAINELTEELQQRQQALEMYVRRSNEQASAYRAGIGELKRALEGRDPAAPATVESPAPAPVQPAPVHRGTGRNKKRQEEAKEVSAA